LRQIASEGIWIFIILIHSGASGALTRRPCLGVRRNLFPVSITVSMYGIFVRQSLSVTDFHPEVGTATSKIPH
jgi:hypothetical protein